MSTKTTLDTLLTDCGADITDFIKSTDFRDEITTALDEWIGLHGLDRVDNTTEILGKQTAFNILLKAALHEQYRHNGYDYPELTHDTTDYRGGLLVAHSKTNDPAFEEFVLDLIAFKLPPRILTTICEERKTFLNTDEPAETIGYLFEKLVPQQARQKLGQFRTPVGVSELMSDWLIDTGNETVLDPGMGAGVLTVKAFTAKQTHTADASISDMYGVDLNSLAVVMCATALQLLDGGDQPHLRADDIMNANPETGSQRFSTDENYTLPTVDRVLSNPPYSRHHELDDDYKTWVNTVTSNEANIDLSSLSPMYVYFYIHASEFLNQGGKLSYITPTEFLENNYGESLKQFLLDNYTLDAFVIYNGDETLFDEAMTTSCISFMEKTTLSDDHTTKFINVDTWPGKEPIKEAIENGLEGETDWGYINQVKQSELNADDKWTTYADPVAITDVSALKPLSSFATIKRGIATGANHFFCISDYTATEHNLDTTWLEPLVRGASYVPNYDYTKTDWETQRDDEQDIWLLYDIDQPLWELQDTPVPEYLKYGKSQDVHETHLAKSRNPWYVVDRRVPADILYTYMNRDGGRFVYNRVGALNLNNLHGMYLDGYSDVEIRALLAYLNSPFADSVVERNGRTLSSGLKKVEPNELKDVPAIDPKELKTDEVGTLAELFDDLCETSRDGADEEAVKDRINDYLEEIFDLEL